ncbi:hypothetical protein GEV33_005603 [Tenebrio molitor]|uniref:Uncharacterized protein n=1 Tax=Tenebrio molitor TaxID=7067 RepID=A0A8J6HPA9_TENMO|nr:hypothetical protein GEV33_005603 [Tenebrio molitor]
MADFVRLMFAFQVEEEVAPKPDRKMVQCSKMAKQKNKLLRRCNLMLKLMVCQLNEAETSLENLFEDTDPEPTRSRTQANPGPNRSLEPMQSLPGADPLTNRSRPGAYLPTRSISGVDPEPTPDPEPNLSRHRVDHYRPPRGRCASRAKHQRGGSPRGSSTKGAPPPRRFASLELSATPLW